MKKWDFEECVKHVLISEGVYSDDVHDHGGATKFGITIGVLTNYRQHEVTKADVQKLSLNEAKDIYKKFYWDAMKLDLIASDARALLLFDQGVNRGIGTAIKQAQSIASVYDPGIKWDGQNGPMTSAAINKLDKDLFCREYLKSSLNAYANICVKNPTQLVFLRGWMNRVYKLLDVCWV